MSAWYASWYGLRCCQDLNLDKQMKLSALTSSISITPRVPLYSLLISHCFHFPHHALPVFLKPQFIRTPSFHTSMRHWSVICWYRAWHSTSYGTRGDGWMSRASVTSFGRSGNLNLTGLNQTNPVRMKPMTLKIDICCFLARRSALLGLLGSVSG